MVFGQVQWRDSERIGGRTLRSDAARLSAGRSPEREREEIYG